MQYCRKSLSLLGLSLCIGLLLPRAAFPQQQTGQVWAVVIGIAHYPKLPGGFQLQFADADARAFAASIERSGVPAQNVKLLAGQDATSDAIRSALGTWLAKSAGPNDIVYIYFSGHGYVEREFNESYLLAVDSDLSDVYGSGISISSLEYLLDRRIKARRVLLMQDAERRDFFGNDQTGRGDSSTFISSFQHLASSRPGMSVIMASGPGEYSWEGRRWANLGAFTKYLVDGIGGAADKDGNGSVTDSELFAFLSEKLPKDTSNKQHPWRVGASELLIALSGQSSSTQPLANMPASVEAKAVEHKAEAPSSQKNTATESKIKSAKESASENPTASAGEADKDESGPSEVRTETPSASKSNAAAASSSKSGPPTSARKTVAPPSVASVNGSTTSSARNERLQPLAAPSAGATPSPLAAEIQNAIAAGNLIEPSGSSAWDLYQQLSREQPSSPAVLTSATKLAESLLSTSRQIVTGDVLIDSVSAQLEDYKRAGRMLGLLRNLNYSEPDVPALQKLSAVEALIALQFYDEAEHSIEPLKQSPNAGVENALGIIYKGQFDDWRAERSFKRAAELDPKWAAPHYNLGLLYQGQGKDDSAAEFEKAAALEPDNTKIQEALGDQYFRQEQWQKAADAYRLAIKSNPKLDTLHTKLGHALYSLGMRDDADKEYKTALELSGRRH